MILLLCGIGWHIFIFFASIFEIFAEAGERAIGSQKTAIDHFDFPLIVTHIFICFFAACAYFLGSVQIHIAFLGSGPD